MKITISLNYWDARHLLDAVRRSDKRTLREFGALSTLYDKLERAQGRVKKAAEDDEFGGMQLPEEFQKIITDDLLKSRVKEEKCSATNLRTK